MGQKQHTAPRAYSPPTLLGDARDGAFGPGVAWLRGGMLDGGCAMAWPGAADGDRARAREINLQFYDERSRLVGSEINVAEIGGAADAPRPQLAALDDGRVAIAWAEPADNALRVRIYHPTGAIDGEATIRSAAASFGQTDQMAAYAIARFAGGGFALAWTTAASSPQSGGWSAHLQTFDAGGAPRVEPVALPAIARLGVTAGGFVATWAEPAVAAAERSLIRAASYGEDGAQQMDAITIAEEVPHVSVAPIGLSDGGFAIVWRGSNPETIRGRRYDADGAPVGGMFFLPRGAIEAANWGDVAGLQLSPEGALTAYWMEDGARQTRPVRVLPDKITSPR